VGGILDVDQVNISEEVSAYGGAEAFRASLLLALIPGVGPRTRATLLEHFGNPQAVLDAATCELRDVPGIGRRLCDRIRAADCEIDVDREIRVCQDNDIAIVMELDARYPRLLREIPDPPAVLFCQGQWESRDQLSMAIVGTRHATHYGRRQTERLSRGLARTGLTVVSGLARGVDGAAHRAALETGGRTIAVLGSGLLNVYPPEHTKLAQAIRQSGVVVSELPPFQKPMSGTFPQRNRLISGLSLGVLVIEAAKRSGALISASHAAVQGREVFAVPGPADSKLSWGCHQLIRDGAKLVQNVEDVLDELGPLVEAVPGTNGDNIHHPAELNLNAQERQLLNAIRCEPTAIEELVVATGLPIQRVLSTISVLEVRHLIRRVSGIYVVRR
jgi:DNA processing protein